MDGYATADMGIGYMIPGLRGTHIRLDVHNLFDSHYRGFVGAPRLGRVLMLGVGYDFRPS